MTILSYELHIILHRVHDLGQTMADDLTVYNALNTAELDARVRGEKTAELVQEMERLVDKMGLQLELLRELLKLACNFPASRDLTDAIVALYNRVEEINRAEIGSSYGVLFFDASEAVYGVLSPLLIDAETAPPRAPGAV